MTPGCDGDLLVGEIDVEDAVHAGEADDDAAAAGSAPPLRPVPAPRATKGMLCFAQMRTTAWTCAVLRGRTTAPGSGAEGGEAVALVGLELVAGGDEICVADGCSEFSDDLRL